MTLHRAAANLYRFGADYGQGVAGLAHHAYHALGWRRVAIVAPAGDGGWSSRDAFTAEFCALGGRVTSHVGPSTASVRPQGPRRRAPIPRDVDGVAVLGAGFFSGPNAFLRRLARRVGDPARHIVLGPYTVDDPDMLKAVAGALGGVVASSYVDPSRRREYLRAFADAFPGVRSPRPRAGWRSGFRDGVEAVLRGIERSGGDTRRLPAALAQLRTDLLGGPVRLDAARQAVVTSRLVRIDDAGELADAAAHHPGRRPVARRAARARGVAERPPGAVPARRGAAAVGS